MTETENQPPWAWLQTPAPHHADYAGSGVWADKTIADLATA
ncbi:hypothetical protein [Sphingomonas sp.]